MFVGDFIAPIHPIAALISVHCCEPRCSFEFHDQVWAIHRTCVCLGVNVIN